MRLPTDRDMELIRTYELDVVVPCCRYCLDEERDEALMDALAAVVKQHGLRVVATAAGFDMCKQGVA